MLLGKLAVYVVLTWFIRSIVGNTGSGKHKPKSETPTKRDKRVSFMPEDASVAKDESAKFDDNDNNITQENLDRLNAKEDPNVS